VANLQRLYITAIVVYFVSFYLNPELFAPFYIKVYSKSFQLHEYPLAHQRLWSPLGNRLRPPYRLAPTRSP